jgi:hypothetical protein
VIGHRSASSGIHGGDFYKYLFCVVSVCRVISLVKQKKKNLYRQRDRRLSTKLMPTFAGRAASRGQRLGSVNLCFLDLDVCSNLSDNICSVTNGGGGVGGSVMVEALRYRREGRGFQAR